MFWAYISMVPYVIPIIIFVMIPFTRKLGHFKRFTLLASCYLFGDKILKNIIRSKTNDISGPRPPHSCKSSFGFPSSHMAVMAAFCFLRLRNQNVSEGEKVIWVAVTFLEGYSRILLNYHTIEQVIAGSIYGIFYAFIFDLIWAKTVGPWLSDKFRTISQDNHVD